jgi:hypothetical protein
LRILSILLYLALPSLSLSPSPALPLLTPFLSFSCRTYSTTIVCSIAFPPRDIYIEYYIYVSRSARLGSS